MPLFLFIIIMEAIIFAKINSHGKQIQRFLLADVS